MEIEIEKENKNRAKIVKVRVNYNELNQLRVLSKMYGKPMAGILRESTLEASKKPSGGNGKFEADQPLVRAVNRIGNNLNQLSRTVNTVAKSDDFLDLMAVHDEIKKIRKATEALISGAEVDDAS